MAERKGWCPNLRVSENPNNFARIVCGKGFEIRGEVIRTGDGLEVQATSSTCPFIEGTRRGLGEPAPSCTYVVLPSSQILPPRKIRLLE